MWLIDFNNVAIEKIQPKSKPSRFSYCVCVWAWRFITTIYFYICLASCVEMGQCERIEPLKIAQKLPKGVDRHTYAHTHAQTHTH